MSLLLTVILEKGFSEHYLANVDNRKYPVSVRPSITGMENELELQTEVWDGKWTISSSKQYTLIRDGQNIASADLVPGISLEGKEKKHGLWFSLKVDETKSSSMGFRKYLVRRDRLHSITIGSGRECHISFKDKFVSTKHAEIIMEGKETYLSDLGSVNGTFLNGKAVQGKVPLKYGGVIYIMGLKIVWLGNLLAVNQSEENCKVSMLEQVNIPAYTDDQEEEDYEKVYFLRTPRTISRLDAEETTVERCAQKQEQKKTPLRYTVGPAFTMVIPIALGAAMSGGGGMGLGGVAMSLGAAGVGAAWAISSAKYSEKEAAAAEAKREKEYIEYIAKLEERLTKQKDYNTRVLNSQFPSSAEALDFAGSLSKRLWEKSSSHSDFLTIRLGLGNVPAPNEVKVSRQEGPGVHDPLNDLGEGLKQKYASLTGVPVTLSLYENRVVGLVSSEEEKRNNLLRLLSLQIAAGHPYTDVRMAYLFKAKDYEQMSYTRWIPHTFTPDGKLRLIACDFKSMGDVMYWLSDLVRERTEDSEDKKARKEGEKVLPHYVVFVNDISTIAGEPGSKYLLDPPEEAGITVVFAANSADRLPARCSVILQDEEDLNNMISVYSQTGQGPDFRFDWVGAAAMDTFTRRLSNFELRDTSSNAEIPDMLTFLDMYKTSRVEDLNMYRNWLENRTYETMKAMVGQKSGGAPVYLDIHEKYHGPHGLVAGTTGSGKSETLQSYILSMAVNYHPHEVAFILIDYKGGGMARSFEGLPHLAGMITNLGGNGTVRALLSINAEIKRRQRIFNEYKVKHIDAYIELYRNGDAEEPMPHLIIIADEFAELKKEQPDFVRALVSAARVGRSLGVNLILATQKPSGVVDDEIWSNTRFRICLRVADKMDSTEMLKRPDAAFITGTGRGFLQVGNDEIFDEFQSGWSGAPYTPDQPFDDGSRSSAQMIGITAKPEVTKKKKKKSGDNLNKVTQLDEIVRYAAVVSKEHNIAPIRQIWLPQLPEVLYLEDLDLTELDRSHMAIPAGLADDPQNQRQFTVFLDFIRDGHLLICGGAGAGKSTLIKTLLFAAASLYTPEQYQFWIADFSSRTMTAFSALPHTGSVCLEGDDEKIADMMEFLAEELERRKNILSEKGMGAYRDYIGSYTDLPAILFIIDNYAAFSEEYEQYEDQLIQMSREAASYGIYMIISCGNTSELRGRIRQGFTKGIGMRLPDRYEYDGVIGARAEILPDDKVIGRGMIKDGDPLEFQAALPLKNAEGIAFVNAVKALGEAQGAVGMKAAKGAVRYERTEYQDLMERAKEQGIGENEFAAGADCGQDRVVTTDLDKDLCFLVSGGAKTGKTNFLKAAAKQMKENGAEIYIFDGVLRELEAFAKEAGADGYMTDAESLYHFMESVLVPGLTERNGLVYEARQEKRSVREALKDYRRIAVIVNSTAEFMEAVYSTEFDMSEFLEVVFDKGAEHKLHFFMAVSPREYNECWQYKAFRMAAEMQTGLHLGGECSEQGIFDFDIPDRERDRQTPAGSALMNLPEGTVRLMTPLVKEENNESDPS